MSYPGASENEFLTKLTEIIETNLTNSQFGVSMLARELGMSRSNLHRKVNSIAKIPVSQFINHVRLKNAMEMLRHTSFNVSDVAHNVGFSNTSYFIKCFHNYYGYPPGEVGNKDEDKSNYPVQFNKKRLTTIIVSATSVIILAVILIIVFKPFSIREKKLEKSIAILPPVYNSSDPNTHIIEGIMETVYNKLALIQDLIVIPSTSTRKYRNEEKTIPKISKELDANYIVESSGHTFDDNIRLTVTLINASDHKIIWSHQYTKAMEDIFIIEDEISKEVAEAIDANITPAEQERIKKKPTKNKIAYNYYLLGSELLNKVSFPRIKNHQDLYDAIEYLEKALEHDNTFALAYAKVASAYYYMKNKIYSDQINDNADKSLLYDNNLPQGLIAKAMYYIRTGKYENAILFLNKALVYDPNSYQALTTLSYIYRLRTPDTGQTLELRLRQNRLKMNGIDSLEKSNFCVRLSDAFCEAGFYTEAKFHLDKSLKFNPNNLWAKLNLEIGYYNMDIDYERQLEFCLNLLKQGSDYYNAKLLTANAFYVLGDYSMAYQYFVELQKEKELPSNGKLSLINVLFKLNMIKEAEQYLNEISETKEFQNSFREQVIWAKYFALMNDEEEAIKHIRIFSNFNNYQYFYISILRDSPIFENFQDLPEYKELISAIETKFWKNHERIKKSLKEKGLL